MGLDNGTVGHWCNYVLSDNSLPVSVLHITCFVMNELHHSLRAD